MNAARDRSRWGRVALLAGTLAVTGVVAAVGATGADGHGRPDLKVAVWTNGTCGTFTDSLPVLLSRSGIRAGDEVGDVTVCVLNTSRRTSALSLGIDERTETDPTCDGQEQAYDTSCGSGPGELGPTLLQRRGLGTCGPAAPGVAPALDQRLPDLETPVLLTRHLPSARVACVRLVLNYSPQDDPAALASQSDRTTWRYVFTSMSKPTR